MSAPAVEAQLELRVLGPLEVLRDGRPLPLAPRKQRALLTLLLLDANHVVSTDRLIDELDGLPLALELAAARTRVLTVQEIADDYASLALSQRAFRGA
jgi:predicted ATPase